MDLSNLNVSELRKLQQNVEREIIIKVRRERSQAIEQIYSIAHSLGMPLNDLLNAKTGSVRKQKPPSSRYVDPSDPSRVWVGRGPRPEWLRTALADGKKLEEFRHPA